jgi:hypothetical protein
MALVSPGVQVSVIDESFYTPAEPGTVPLIFIATQTNKTNPGGTGIAPGTLASNAGKVYLVSSQRELSETFGDALFYTDANNNPIHGGEQNEYGLQAAYSFLGVSNRAYVVRANLDLSAITASATETAGKPANGAYWFDTNDSLYGVFEWNGNAGNVTGGQTFTNKVPTVITDTTKVVNFTGGDYTPKGSVGAIGDYAVVAVTNTNKLWYKNSSGNWVAVGSAQWKASFPFVTASIANPTLTTGKVFGISLTADSSGSTLYEIITTGTTVTQLAADINANTALVADGVTADVTNGRLNLYYSGAEGDVVEIFGHDATFAALGITQPRLYYPPSLQVSPHTQVPQFKTADVAPRPTGSIWVKTTTPNLGANWDVKRYSSETASWTKINSPIYATNHAAIYGLDSTGGGANIAEGALYIQYNSSETANTLADFKIFRKNGTGATTITSSRVSIGTFPIATYTFTMLESTTGVSTLNSRTISFTSGNVGTDADTLADAINSAGFTNVTATVDSQNRVVISHATGGDIRIIDTTGGLDNIFTPFDASNSATTTNLYYVPGTDVSTSPKQFVATLWKALVYEAQDTEPTTIPEDGALWYSSIVDEVDIMAHDGSTWRGYREIYPATDPAGPIVSASEPINGERSDNGNLVNGDLWISTADIQNYPQIYRYNSTISRWVLIDKTDQTSEDGVLFADARYNTAGENSDVAGDIADLLESDYLDPDAPDPALYPRGMLLWNLRRSGFNVKRFERNYVDINAENVRFDDESMANYYPHRWVTESQNNDDGSGSFGRNAQRKVVVRALQASVNNNDDIRDDESRILNLIACPGYPELIGELINLNFDRGLTAFVVGDSPARLQPTTTAINDWATNVNRAVEDNDVGLVSRDEYLGVYYPWGFASDNAGNNIVVPPSHMVMRVIALNDQVAYPWFAPAGTRRGGVTNATATGFLNNEGEFVSVALNTGQRDTLYQNNVNPITFLNGAGLVVYGQKTRARNASALDRVNVARLVIYLRSQLKTLAKPYIFEPNDKITRDEIKQQVESLMVELVGLRAIYDYLVVCDETNNTPSRIDRNELYVDIAIEPVKAIEFIYIPLRLKNTGEIAGL